MGESFFMTDSNVKVFVEGEGTQSTLLERIQKQDAEGWKTFVRLYTPLLFQWCRRAGLQDTDAADVAQDVFYAVSKSIATFSREREGGTFRGWLRTITTNKIRDRHRLNVPGAYGVGGDDGMTVTHEAPEAREPFSAADAHGPEDELTLMRRAVEIVLGDYEEHTRAAFLRVTMGEESAADVARDLNMTVNVVYLAKSRIMRRIREEFAGLIETL